MTEESFGGDVGVRAETTTSLDADADCPSLVTVIVQKDEKSRRNCHQSSQRRHSSISRKRKQDNRPVQTLVTSGKKSQKSKDGVFCGDNKCMYDQKNRGKAEKNSMDKSEEKISSSKKEMLEKNDMQKEKVDAPGEDEVCDAAENELRDTDEVRGPPKEEFTSEIVDNDMQIRGPPDKKFGFQEAMRNPSKTEESEIETQPTASLNIETSGAPADKKSKDEMNSLRAAGEERRSQGIKETWMRVQLPCSMKTQERDQQAMLEKLHADRELGDKSELDEKADKGKEKHEKDEAEKCQVKMKFLWCEGKESEARVKQVNEDGVTCYLDNRLVEERQREETISKQRLDPLYSDEIGGNLPHLSVIGGNHSDQSEIGGNHSDQSEIGGNQPDQSEIGGNQPDQSEIEGNHSDQSEKSQSDQSDIGGNQPDQSDIGGNQPDQSEKKVQSLTDNNGTGPIMDSGTSLNKAAENVAQSSQNVLPEMGTIPADDKNRGTSLQNPSEAFGTSQKELTEKSWSSVHEMTESSWTGTGKAESSWTGTGKATEGSWHGSDESCVSGFYPGQHLGVPVVNSQPAFRPELLSMLGLTKCPPVEKEQFVPDSNLYKLGTADTISHTNTLGTTVLKVIKDQINQIYQDDRSSNPKKKEETVKAHKDDKMERGLDKDKDDHDEDFMEKYKDEESEKESMASTDEEKETCNTMEEMGTEAVEEYLASRALGKVITELEEELILHDADRCSSLKTFPIPRQQEVEDMRRALDVLDAKFTDFSLEIKSELKKLKGLEDILSDPSLGIPRRNSNNQSMNPHNKLRTALGMLRGRPPNNPRKPRHKLSTEWQNCFGMPEKPRDGGRRLGGFRGHNFGRTCSNAGGQEGSYSEGSDGASKNNRNSGRDESGNHSNGNQNTDRNNEGNDGDGNEEKFGSGSRSSRDADVPGDDWKRYKKKHVRMSAASFENWLGTLKLETEIKKGPVWEIENYDLVFYCVSCCLASPDDLSQSDDMLTCHVCVGVSSLLKHYADCSAPYNACTMCLQTFSLICAHVTDCINNNSEEGSCDIKLCINILQHVADGEISNHLKTLWFHIRKKLARIIGDCEVETMSSQESVQSMSRKRSSVVNPSLGHPSLPSIPENVTAPTGSGSNSRVLARKRSSNLTNVAESAEITTSLEDEGDHVAEGETTEETTSPGATAPAQTLYTRETGPAEARGETTNGEEQGASSMPVASGGSSSSVDMVDVVPRPQFQARIQSLPQGSRNFLQQNYYPSIADRPFGIKGIGEVWYGDRPMLVVVADYWHNLKAMYKESGKLAPQYREEGIILQDFKHLLIIQGLRYNSQFQFVKHNPLGNGMSGKCHLASDWETNHNFCIKEIHISNYEKEEIELWSELEHPNIVKIYGAIRHRETIFILQEFIEGGNLTETINIQKTLGRRLSQVTALAYFRQLLQVLIHLRKKHVLHEDLKADNILLKQEKGCVSIKVTDFGLARRCPDRMREGTAPAGTQTQWSPEKAEGKGYGYPAEVWAAVCVLVHLLSGYPPWIRRFEQIKSLIVVIVQQSPPVEDIPQNIDADVRDLIQRCFTVCQNTRPHPQELLKHQAFRLLDEASNGKTTSILYSNLPSAFAHPSLNTLENDPNADLRQIIEDIDKEKRSKQVPKPVTSYNVYTLHNGQQNGTAHGQNTGRTTETRDILVGIEREFGENEGATGIAVDPYTIQQYLSDHAPPIPPPPARQDMRIYDPNNPVDELEEAGAAATSEDIIQELLPDFAKLGLGAGDMWDNIGHDNDDDVEYEKEDIFKEFDLAKAIPELVKKMDSAYLSSEIPDSREQSTTDIVDDNTENTEPNNTTTSVENDNKSNAGNNKTLNEGKEKDGAFVIYDDKYHNVKDDELFMSGPGDSGTIPHDSKPLVRVALTKASSTNVSSNPRSLVAVSESGPVQHPTPAAVGQDLSLGPYLLPQDSFPRHSTPQKSAPHNIPRSPESGPGEAKRQKMNPHTPTVSPINTPSRQGQVVYRRENPATSAQFGDGAGASNFDPALDQFPDGTPESSRSWAQAGSGRSRKEELDEQNRNQQRKNYISRHPPQFFVTRPKSPKSQLVLDVDKARQGPVTPTTYAQTAPVISPPRDQPVPKYQRTTSERVQPTQAQTGQPIHKTSSSTSTSQYDQQELAFKELEDAMSQHSDPSNLILNDDEDDDYLGGHGEFDFDVENPAPSIAQYLDQSPSDSIKVTFKNVSLKVEQTVKFPMKSKSMSWEKILEEEFGRHTELFAGYERVLLTYENGVVLDLQESLGETSVTVLVEAASGDDRWWIESGVLMKS